MDEEGRSRREIGGGEGEEEEERDRRVEWGIGGGEK